MLKCSHFKICGICTWLDIPEQQQQEQKIRTLREALKAEGIPVPADLGFRSAGASQIRDRVDLIYQDGLYGFYRADSRNIFQIETCLQMSVQLSQFFAELQKVHLPIRKGSLRLRVSPTGQRGIWLDFANLDVKYLLEEKTTLFRLLDLGFVEIGQKRKKLSREMKLVSPEPQLWTRTWLGDQPLPLFSFVGSFSQVGDRANQILIRELQSIFRACSSQNWVEFGSGNGNLSFALAETKSKVAALESDLLALSAFSMTLKANPFFISKISISGGDYQRNKYYVFQKHEGILVNPPRSGLQNFLDPLFLIPRDQRPHDFIYMSCYLESFLKDSRRLLELGYVPVRMTIVDQFPQTTHFELLSRWALGSVGST